MAIFYLPRIDEAEWPRFKSLIVPCPADSYAEWRAFQAKELADIRAARHSAKLVDVSAADYARFRRARRGRRDIEGLRAYVFERATGKRY